LNLNITGNKFNNCQRQSIDLALNNTKALIVENEFKDVNEGAHISINNNTTAHITRNLFWANRNAINILNPKLVYIYSNIFIQKSSDNNIDFIKNRTNYNNESKESGITPYLYVFNNTAHFKNQGLLVSSTFGSIAIKNNLCLNESNYNIHLNETIGFDNYLFHRNLIINKSFNQLIKNATANNYALLTNSKAHNTGAELEFMGTFSDYNNTIHNPQPDIGAIWLNGNNDNPYFNTTHISTDLKSQISCYPNPVVDLLYIKNNNNITATIEIFNNSGKLISKKRTDSNFSVISLKKHPQGLYLLKVTSSYQSFTKLILVKP
ncbi:MAG: T9SS type A sorting domain-containing protein, partial [Bacteroidia bacterium]